MTAESENTGYENSRSIRETPPVPNADELLYLANELLHNRKEGDVIQLFRTVLDTKIDDIPLLKVIADLSPDIAQEEEALARIALASDNTQTRQAAIRRLNRVAYPQPEPVSQSAPTPILDTQQTREITDIDDEDFDPISAVISGALVMGYCLAVLVLVNTILLLILAIVDFTNDSAVTGFVIAVALIVVTAPLWIIGGLVASVIGGIVGFISGLIVGSLVYVLDKVFGLAHNVLQKPIVAVLYGIGAVIVYFVLGLEWLRSIVAFAEPLAGALMILPYLNILFVFVIGLVAGVSSLVELSDEPSIKEATPDWLAPWRIFLGFGLTTMDTGETIARSHREMEIRQEAHSQMRALERLSTNRGASGREDLKEGIDSLEHAHGSRAQDHAMRKLEEEIRESKRILDEESRASKHKHQ